jgi:hypothetical protein
MGIKKDEPFSAFHLRQGRLVGALLVEMRGKLVGAGP